MTVPEELALAAEFPAASREEWQRLLSGVLAKSGKTLAGPDAEAALSTEVEDGLTVRPLYTADDLPGPDAGLPGFAPFARGGRASGREVPGNPDSGWDVRQHHAHPDPDRTNAAILADLDHGVTSLWLTAGGDGLPVTALPAALKGVYLDLAGVSLDAGAEFAAAAEQMLSLYSQVPASEVTGNLGADPLGLLARTGDSAATAEHQAEAARLAARCAREFPGLRALVADALPYHDAGASAADELGLALATAVAYLRALTSAGLSPDEAAGQIEFRYAATADQFTTIAKLRAARLLWSRVAEVSGVGPAGAAQRQHAVTSSVMMTARDPWVNMLRTTVACLAAGTGGADAVTVLPFDSALGLPDDFARRIARNTQAILLEESNLARVIDPAGGSWYVESLTLQLAQNAWAYFQDIERAGGLEAALGSGTVAARLADDWEKRSKNLARRKEAVTGVSEFPNLAEKPVVRDPAPAPAGGGLPRVRRAGAFEALRTRSDALAGTGARPKVALAALGSPAVYTARSTFAANLFQAGGIETPLVEAGDGPDLDALAAAFRASGASGACLCSSDAVYAEHGEAAAAALKAAGARRVVLAGRPGDRREAYASAGVDDFVYAGCDAVAALTAAIEGEAR
ncbi:MAG: methylmalonyl-CoA mutase subunit beta [Streptosporangiales bacterium]|nr:methylmalonyl-CoA mutase subunit beta [Streptosporangiales bacterium]